MMIHPIPHKKIRIAFAIPFIALLAASCGSYQQSSYYDNDGIYSNNNQRYTERPTTEAPQEDNTYANYFGQKADEYQEILDSEIFTDIDGYYGQEQDNAAIGADGNYINDYNDYNGYGAWGDNPSSLTINYVNNGWAGNYGFGWNNWGWDGYYGAGWGWNNWRWRGYNGFGWNNWG